VLALLPMQKMLFMLYESVFKNCVPGIFTLFSIFNPPMASWLQLISGKSQ
jgi:hypothetical protein